MGKEDSDPRLSRISTLWTVVCRAKGGPAAAVTAAQEELMHRYRRAVYRYLLGALRDPDAADELTQEFCCANFSGLQLAHDLVCWFSTIPNPCRP